MKLIHHGMTASLCVCLVLGSIPNVFADQTQMSGPQQPAEATQLTPEQLQQLVAPIALYPDPLIGQILAAATYPTQIVEAEKWMQQHQGLTGDALAREVDKQQWDPSVKALTQFPVVLANMNQNLAWTSELGDAYVNQQHDLTQGIQTMRQRAMSAGTLKSTPQEIVKTDDSAIEIEPASTDSVYVPQYDPWVVYGTPLPAFPGWLPYPGLYLSGPGIGLGLGFGVGLFAGYAWGWNHWGCDWHHGGVVYNHQAFVSHSRNIVNRNSFHSNLNHAGSARINAAHGTGVHGGRLAGHAASHTAGTLHASAARHSSASSHFAHGGASRTHAFFHSGASHAFHGGGRHGGGHHGGGHRR